LAAFFIAKQASMLRLRQLNDKFKIRATELTLEPGAYLGVHHHVGPGVRYVISGELTFTEGGQATIYKAGDYYFETGNLANTAENKTNLPLRVLVVDILRKDWMGPAVIPPKGSANAGRTMTLRSLIELPRSERYLTCPKKIPARASDYLQLLNLNPCMVVRIALQPARLFLPSM
jgi:quercetin dioxygenase-like cupin family protein